mmetsp:Transcript_133296/g.265947  ORF Transcript_133296/g.265947 Transcript_133296/m.265947 type:complete len:116 (-) Transcript_133296:674-1021(-)
MTLKDKLAPCLNSSSAMPIIPRHGFVMTAGHGGARTDWDSQHAFQRQSATPTMATKVDTMRSLQQECSCQCWKAFPRCTFERNRDSEAIICVGDIIAIPCPVRRYCSHKLDPGVS